MLRRLAPKLVWAVVAFNLFLIGPGVLSSARRGLGDFEGFYAGFRLVFTPRLYDREAVLAIQAPLPGGENPELMPIRLPFYYALFSPLARFPFQVGQIAWSV